MLQIQDLKSGYDELEVLKGVDLKFEPGKIIVLMGPNGAGKSTLIKSIFNLNRVISGRIKFEGDDITKMSTHQLLELGIGYVSQGRINFSILTVEENLLIGAHHIEDKQLVKENLEKIYEEFSVLKEKRNQYAFSLSGGQQQMLAIGRALMNNPKLLLLDEPSLGLSPKLVKETFEKIKEINERFNTTILIVEHNIKSVLNIVDYVYVMMNGKIVAEGNKEKIKKSEVIKEVFLGKWE